MTLRMRDGVIDRVARRERARSVPGSLIDRMALRADTQVGSSRPLAALGRCGGQRSASRSAARACA